MLKERLPARLAAERPDLARAFSQRSVIQAATMQRFSQALAATMETDGVGVLDATYLDSFALKTLRKTRDAFLNNPAEDRRQAERWFVAHWALLGPLAQELAHALRQEFSTSEHNSQSEAVGLIEADPPDTGLDDDDSDNEEDQDQGDSEEDSDDDDDGEPDGDDDSDEDEGRDDEGGEDDDDEDDDGEDDEDEDDDD